MNARALEGLAPPWCTGLLHGCWRWPWLQRPPERREPLGNWKARPCAPFAASWCASWSLRRTPAFPRPTSPRRAHASRFCDLSSQLNPVCAGPQRHTVRQPHAPSDATRLPAVRTSGRGVALLGSWCGAVQVLGRVRRVSASRRDEPGATTRALVLVRLHALRGFFVSTRPAAKGEQPSWRSHFPTPLSTFAAGCAPRSLQLFSHPPAVLV